MLVLKETGYFLENLMKTFSPSGNEKDSLNVWKNFCMKLELKPYYSDKMGNSAFSIGTGPIKILLSGHIDEVSSTVQSITKDGSLTIINNGGMCRKSLIASEVVIIGGNYPVVGVVEKKPIHCEDEKERDTVNKIETLRINIGASSREEVEALGIYPGCQVCYQRRSILDFGKNQICGTGLDDKTGVFIVGNILKKLAEGKDTNILSKYTIIGCACCQEEVGARGAKIVSRNINPDISIDFDVTFSTDGDLGLSPSKYGDVVLGKGGVIKYGPDKSTDLANTLRRVCKNYDIPFQTAASRAGGTNTHIFQEFSEDCQTALISIPNRSMHTPIEVCDWRDLDSAISMVYNAIIHEEL